MPRQKRRGFFVPIKINLCKNLHSNFRVHIFVVPKQESGGKKTNDMIYHFTFQVCGVTFTKNIFAPSVLTAMNNLRVMFPTCKILEVK